MSGQKLCKSIEISPGIRTSYLCPDGQLLKTIYPDVTTIYEAFLRGVKVSNNGLFLGTLQETTANYSWKTYQEIFDSARWFGSFLLNIGLRPGKETIVGSCSKTREEYTITAQAVNMFSLVLVPLYEHLDEESAVYIINQTQLTLMVCDTWAKVSKFLTFIIRTPSLRTIIVMESNLAEECTADEILRNFNIRVAPFRTAMHQGRDQIKDPCLPRPEDLALISYTSGTTGLSKGVQISHRAMISVCSALHSLMQMGYNSDDIFIAYLPMAHMFEQFSEVMMMMNGCKIGYYGGDVSKLFNNMQILRPTVFFVVPRLLTILYDRVMNDINSSRLRSLVFKLALSRKYAQFQSKGLVTSSSFWDRLAFGRAQRALGGRVRALMCGSAPISPAILTFMRCAFGCATFESYGLTECGGPNTATIPGERDSGHVGPPLPNSLIKLIDVPNMNYYVTNSKGEICIKSTAVMSGYYKNEEKTREMIDDDGWLHTGDIGEWTKDGDLKIIDRRKHFFKLAQGEHIAPAKIEKVYVKSPLVAQIYIDGSGLHNHPVAIVVPDVEAVKRWAEAHNIQHSFDQLCKNSLLRQVILEDLHKLGVEASLAKYEQVQAIHLHDEPFSMENDLLTPSLKPKRDALRQRFQNEINRLYSQKLTSKL